MRSVVRVLIPVAIVALAAIVVGMWLGVTMADVRHWGQTRNVLEVAGQQVRIPGPEGPSERRLPQVPVTTTGSHAFMFDAGGEPVRYDPCRPIDWVLNPTGMPDAVEPLLHEAAQSVQAASGLEFSYQGVTDEVASFDRDVIQDRYDGFAPLIIGFSTEEQDPELAGSITGIGGSSSVYGAYGEQEYLRAGIVVLDSDDLGELVSSTSGEALARAVIEHELAHVIGLAHVQDSGELMNETNTRLTEWGPGDLQGLAILGAGPCEAP